MAYALERYERQVIVASGLDALAGVWLFVSPFVLAFTRTTEAKVNNLVCGVIVAYLGAARFRGPYRPSLMSWATFVIGLWVAFSPWAIGFSAHRIATANNLITGIVIAALGLWSSLASTLPDEQGRMLDDERR